MKKYVSVLLAVLLIAVFCVFALGSGDSGTDEQVSGAADGVTDSASGGKAGPNLDDVNIEIKSCRLAEDYSGKPVVIVTYAYTNYSDDAQSFTVAVQDEVYQDGVGLNGAYILDDSANYSADNQSKEVKKGTTLDVEVAYELNDTTTNIEVEVKPFFSFKDVVVKKTFSLK